MIKKLIVIVCLFTFIGGNVIYAQSSAVKKIIETAKTDNQTMKHLDILTNRFGGRLVGSDGYENAADWMIREFNKWGIEAHLEEAGEVPVGFNRGPWFGRLIGGDQPMNLHFCTPSYTSGTKGIQRGHVLIEPQSQAEFDRMKHQLKGAWVLVGGVNSGWPLAHSVKDDSIRNEQKIKNAEIVKKNNEIRMNNRLNNTNEPLMEIKPIPGLFYREMVEAGVLGFIQSSTVPIRALYDRPMVNDKSTTFDNLPEVCDIKLDENQYNVIKKMAQERREFWLEFDIRNHFKLGPVKYHNVVATIKGSQYPNEYVIISGHLDAFDVATGGVDCGTGIAPMMEAARLIALSGAKPKRTIVFVGFAAEEFGLLGAQAYAKSHKNELKNISYLFNRDGGPTPPIGISVPQAMYDDFVEVCKPIKDINPEYPFEVTVAKPRKKPTSMGGTDASVFAMQGVPSDGFREGDFKGYNFNYGEIWHTERDLYTKSIPEYMEHTSVVTAVVALGVANLKKQLSREGLYIE